MQTKTCPRIFKIMTQSAVNVDGMISGAVNADGEILCGEGFTVTKVPEYGEGFYVIKFGKRLDYAPVVTATISFSSIADFNVVNAGNTSIAVSCGGQEGFNVFTTLASESKPMDFTFIAVWPVSVSSGRKSGIAYTM